MEKYSKNKSFVANYLDSIPVIAEKPSSFHSLMIRVWCKASFNPFLPSAAFYVQTSHCFAKQITGFYMKCNTVRIWILHRNAWFGYITGKQGSHIESITCHSKFKDKLHEITVNKVIISLKLKSTCFTCPCMFMINRVLDLLHKANWSTFRGNEWTEFIRIPAEEPPIPPWNVCKHSPDFTFQTYQMNNTPNKTLLQT